MRKILLLLFTLVISCTALAETASEATLEELLEQKAQLEAAIAQAEEDEIVAQAIETLTEYWASEIYDGIRCFSENGYLEIKWTRVVYIKDNVTGTGTEQFADMNCYVEFFLLTDYFDSAPYYSHAGVSECVAFKKDGSFEVLDRDPIAMYRGKTFQVDFEPIIESISDREADFNQVFTLLE